MRERFYVIDHAGNVCYDDDGEPESFSRQRGAIARARALAAATPGHDIIIAKAIAVVKAPVGNITITTLGAKS